MLAELTQSDLADECGWHGSQSRIANYETALRVPSLADMRLIVDTLNKRGCKCSIDDVFPPVKAPIKLKKKLHSSTLTA